MQAPAMSSFRSAFAAAATAAALGCAQAEELAERTLERGASKRECLSTAQTRETIDAHKLKDPFSCMRAAAQQLSAEALGARLCLHEETFVYEISVIRPDGRVVRVLFDAATGRPHSGRKDN